MLNNKPISGIYTVEKKTDLIWLRDKNQQIVQTFPYFTFKTLLLQCFTEDQIKILMEVLDCSDKLLIDFDKGKAKKIILKDEPFINHMKTFMNVNAVREEYENAFLEETDTGYINF